MKIKNSFLIIQLLLLCFFTKAESKNVTLIDAQNESLYENNEQLVMNFINKKDTIKALHYANLWLNKAKQDNNLIQQTKSYKAIMHLVEKKFRMIYADSLLNNAFKTKNDNVIGGAYLTIGASFYDSKDYSKALDNYILANNFIVKTNNQYQIYKVKYSIAQIKYYLGYFDEAIALFTECIDYFKTENETAYIKSLHSIGLCYNQIERYDLCTFNNTLGIKLAKEFEIEEMILSFKNSEGINQYKLKHFENAIKLLFETLPQIENSNDNVNKVITWFYLGKCFWDLDKKEDAINYFTKAEQTISDENFIRPDLREIYELLIEYYKNKQNPIQQLKYIDKLLLVDKLLNKNYKYLSYKTHKEFDTKTLLQSKLEIEKKLVQNKKKYISFIIVLFSLLTGLTVWHFRSKKINKQKFKEIISELPTNNQSQLNIINKSKVVINDQVTKEILVNLKKFEDNKKFLEKDMNLVKMASLLKTNTKYVSLIISEYRGKKLTNYINDLKIDYIIELLKNHSKYRNYTNKALAEEAGFGSTQIFTKAFKSKNKISPTYFIEEIKKHSEEVIN